MKKDSALNPIDRNAEILFGLFMALTFTGALSVATAGREEVRTMLIAALTCNMAWGFVDAIMYIMRALVGRERKRTFVRDLRNISSQEEAHQLIASEAPALSGIISDADLESLRSCLIALHEEEAGPPTLSKEDIIGAVKVFSLVTLSTIPVVLPFIFLDNLYLAMRLSGVLTISILFFCGYGWARYAGMRPFLTGTLMVFLGIIIEAVVIFLGG